MVVGLKAHRQRGKQADVFLLDFTSKNLKRLFPTDQSMVVVIDDRQDVWGDCPNLVKVVPCKLSCAPS